MTEMTSSPSPKPTPAEFAQKLGEGSLIPNVDEVLKNIDDTPIAHQAVEFENVRLELVEILNQTRVTNG